jgi:hypothetical protein
VAHHQVLRWIEQGIEKAQTFYGRVAHDMIDINTTGNIAFAVRLERTAKNKETHGKEHTTPFCTVNRLCRALFIKTHGNPLPCANVDARQTNSRTH